MKRFVYSLTHGWSLHGSGFLVTLVTLLLVSISLVSARTDDGYDLTWWTVDGGGAVLGTGDGYSLSGTAGQCDAHMLADGGYTLVGGFWGGEGALVPPDMYPTYLPLVLRNLP